jgi:hypothetical protein
MSDSRWSDPREHDPRDRGDEWPRVYDPRDRDERDPRDALMRDLDLPRSDARELVVDRDRVYELDGEDSRTLAAVGVFRVVPEHDLDLPHDTLDTLHDQRLVETVELGDGERGLTLTTDGRDLLDSHRTNETASRRISSTPAPAAHGRSTTTRICMQRFDRKKLAFETSTLTLRSGASSSNRTSSASTRNSCRSTIATAPTATAGPVVMRTRSTAGHAITTCRTSTTTCIFPTTESSTRLMAGNFTRTLNSSPRTTAARTLPAAERPASGFTSSPLAVTAVVRDRIRA